MSRANQDMSQLLGTVDWHVGAGKEEERIAAKQWKTAKKPQPWNGGGGVLVMSSLVLAAWQSGVGGPLGHVCPSGTPTLAVLAEEDV